MLCIKVLMHRLSRILHKPYLRTHFQWYTTIQQQGLHEPNCQLTLKFIWNLKTKKNNKGGGTSHSMNSKPTYCKAALVLITHIHAEILAEPHQSTTFSEVERLYHPCVEYLKVYGDNKSRHNTLYWDNCEYSHV